LLVDFVVDLADGYAERRTALTMLDESRPGNGSVTVGADKAYDTRGFVAGCRALRVVPHVAQHTTRSGGSAIDGRTTRHPGYRVSQRVRKRVEEIFGWVKTVGGLRKTRHCGRALVEWFFVLTTTAYNLIRIPKILAATG